MKVIIQNLERFPARSSFFRWCFVGNLWWVSHHDFADGYHRGEHLWLGFHQCYLCIRYSTITGSLDRDHVVLAVTTQSCFDHHHLCLHCFATGAGSPLTVKTFRASDKKPTYKKIVAAKNHTELVHSMAHKLKHIYILYKVMRTIFWTSLVTDHWSYWLDWFRDSGSLKLAASFLLIESQSVCYSQAIKSATETITPWKLTYHLKIDGWKMKCSFKMVPFQRTVAHFFGGRNLSFCQVGVLALSVFPIIFVTVPQGSSSVLAASYSMAAAETIDPWITAWTKIFKQESCGNWVEYWNTWFGMLARYHADCDFGCGNIPGKDTTQSLTLSKSTWIPRESNELSLKSNYTFACSPWLLVFRRYCMFQASLHWWKKSRTTWDV